MAANEVSVERIDEARVRLRITVPQATVDAALDDAQGAVKGLKARPLGKKQLGIDPEKTAARAVANRATRSVVEEAVREAVESKGIRLTANPDIDLGKAVERGCDFAFSFVVQVVPELDVEPFERLTVILDDAGAVTDADVDAKLEEIRVRSARIEKGSEEPVGPSDLVRISFSSMVDGREYEGNRATGIGYRMGSLTLPQAFEDGLLGMRSGQSRTIEFTVPDDFENRDIAGKPARFDVELHDVAKVVLPDLDDAFAREFDYRDLGHFRTVLRDRVAREKSAQMSSRREKRAREALAERLIGAVPESMVSAQALRMLEVFKMQLGQQGVEFAEYCGYLGIAEQDVLAEMRGQAATDVRENLALEALYRQVGLEATREDRQRTADDLALDSGLPPDLFDVGLSRDRRAAIDEMTRHRLATEWLLAHCDFVME